MYSTVYSVLLLYGFLFKFSSALVWIPSAFLKILLCYCIHSVQPQTRFRQSLVWLQSGVRYDLALLFYEVIPALLQILLCSFLASVKLLIIFSSVHVLIKFSFCLALALHVVWIQTSFSKILLCSCMGLLSFQEK